jgi:hypothetical protein
LFACTSIGLLLLILPGKATVPVDSGAGTGASAARLPDVF